MRGLHLFGRPLVRLLRALPDRFAIPVELVPPDSTALVDCHYSPPFFVCFLALPLGRPPFLPHSDSSSFECLLARAFPPSAPVRWKYFSTSFGILVGMAEL